MLIRSVLFNFQGAFLNSVFLISQTTLLLYHIFSSLSRGFSIFFEVFLIFDHFVMFSSRSRDSFYIILSLFEKVNPFFKNIQKNFAQLVFRVLHKIYVFEYIK